MSGMGGVPAPPGKRRSGLRLSRYGHQGFCFCFFLVRKIITLAWHESKLMSPHQNEKHRILSDVADLACFQGTISGEKMQTEQDGASDLT